MNLSQNFIKLVFACNICVFIVACEGSPNQPDSGLTSSSSTPAANQSEPKPTLSPLPPPLIASSHNRERDENNSVNAQNWRLVNGQSKTFANYQGKALILDFWATYCPPCEEEIPHLVELSNKYPADLHVVGLHVGGEEDKPNVSGFVSKYKMTYDLGYPGQDLMDFYLEGDDRIPQTLVFDRRGQLVQKFVGFTPEIKEQIDQAVQTAVASK